MADIALVVVFCMCSLKFNWELSQTPRYWIDLAGSTVLSSPGMFVGMVMEGPAPACLPLVDLVKWIRSFLTWSSLRPHEVSQQCASLNTISTICIVVVRSRADAAIEPSST